MINENRLIAANVVEARIEKTFKRLVAKQSNPELAAALSYVSDLIVDAPTVDAVEVVHGQWIEKPYLLGTTRYCSICGQNYGMSHGVFNYCPNCGAKMYESRKKKGEV